VMKSPPQSINRSKWFEAELLVVAAEPAEREIDADERASLAAGEQPRIGRLRAAIAIVCGPAVISV